MRVGDIMQEPAIVVSEDDELERVARAMLEHQVPCVAVTDARGRLVGVIRDDDFAVHDRNLPFSIDATPHLLGEPVCLDRIEREYETARVRRAREVMVPDGRVIGEQAPLSEALVELQAGSSLLVVRGDRPVGFLARHDLLKLIQPPPEPAG